MNKYVGVDWASKGWLCVVRTGDGVWTAEMQPSIHTVWCEHRDTKTVLFDWIDVHPLSDGPDAYVFIGALDHHYTNPDEPLCQGTIRRMLLTTTNHANVGSSHRVDSSSKLTRLGR